ncbi:MAG: 2-hydroxyacid dehydrogenase [Pseudomonadota bacterium]
MTRLGILTPIYAPFMESLTQDYQTTFLWQDADPADLEVLVSDGTKPIDGARMDRYPSLTLIALLSVGYDSVDIPAANERGIRVTHTPGAMSDDVANLALALTINALRRLPEADRYVRDQQWPIKELMKTCHGLAGAKAGVLGLGRIGTAIAYRLQACGAVLAYHARNERPDAPWRYEPDLIALARWARVLVIACPGGESTHHLVDHEIIHAIGPEGVLVNIGRGSVVDEDAMIAALQSGALGNVGLDVYANEPHVPDALCQIERAALAPHIGSQTHHALGAMARMVRANIDSVLKGDGPLNPCDSVV